MTIVDASHPFADDDVDYVGNLNLMRQATADIITEIDFIENVDLAAKVGVVATYSALLLITPATNGQQISLSGYTSANDGGGNIFVWNSSSSATHNAVTIIKPTAVSGNGRWIMQCPRALSINAAGAYAGNSDANNKTALQSAILAAAAIGCRTILIPSTVSYGCKVTDASTWPDLSTVAVDMFIEDWSEGDSYSSPAKDGMQFRRWYRTVQTSPAGQHDGNTEWVRGAWSPWIIVSNDANLAAAGHGSRTADDNRRTTVGFACDGELFWSVGMGTLSGAAYTDDQLSNFSIKAFANYAGGVVAGTSAMMIERSTGNFGFNVDPQASYHFKSATTGSIQMMVQSGTAETTSTFLLRNSNGSGDDVRLRNVSGAMDVVVNGSSLFTILKSSPGYTGLNCTPAYRFEAKDSRASNYVAGIENTSSTNGYGLRIVSATAAGTGFSFCEMYSLGADKEFNFRGDGNAFADGTFTGTPADIAELWEWEDGNPFDEDRVGWSVVLVGEYIRKALPSDDEGDIIGIISALPSFLGNSDWNHWNGKYLKDDFGRYIMEDCEVWEWETYPYNEETEEYERIKHSYHFDKVPASLKVPENKKITVVKRKQLNPKFDSNKTHDTREDRKEWGKVGILGQIPMVKGMPVRKSWRKMKDISDKVERWYVK